LTIFLDVPVDIAVQRLIVRGEPTTIFEKKAKLQQVRQAYLDIGPTFGEFVTVDGVGSPKEVSERVIEVVYSHII
jgi:thymidylate kinase